jgi:chromosome segregation ATPase
MDALCPRVALQTSHAQIAQLKEQLSTLDVVKAENGRLKEELATAATENAQGKEKAIALNVEKADVQQRLTFQGHAYRGVQQECEQLKEELADREAQVEAARALGETRKGEVELWKVRSEQAERDAEDARAQLTKLRAGLAKIGEAVKECGS